MPFVQRTIEPVFLSRPTQQQQQQSSAIAAGESSSIAKAKKQSQNDDFTLIANCTLANVLRQLGSVVLIADEILSDLGNELHRIRIRSDKIQKRITNVEKSLENIEETIIYKPNDTKNFVDDKDVSIYKTKQAITLSLFTPETRPQHITKLYEKAAATPVVVISNGDTNSEVNFALCSRSSFGHTRRHIKRKIDAEIETRMPASIEELRKWTSSEAIGEITVGPNCLAKVGTSSLHNNNNNSSIAEESYASFSTSYVDGIDVTSTSTNDMVDGINDVPLDHTLPSPEEQCFTIAQKYPAEIVSVNTSEVRFDRMCSIRKSLGHMPTGKARYLDEFQPVRRSTRGRKPSGKRRNTIAGIDDKDIKEAFTQMRQSTGQSSSDDKKGQIMPRSKSNDLLRANGTDSIRGSNRFSNFRALKQWGKHRLKLINKSNESRIEEDTEYDLSDKQINSQGETRTMRLKTKSQAEKMLKQNPLFGSSEKIFHNLIEVNTKNCSSPSPTHPVKLRTTMTRRQKRTKQYRCEEPNSSSGNWSASSESGRTSASSEVAMHNKTSNSCSSLNHRKSPVTNCTSALTKRKINTSTSSSITSDDTMAHEIPSSGYVELYDDETSSMYSCDTEGYFTSFHVDSGLKTLKEEELPAVPALLSTSALLPINDSVSSSLGDSHSRTTIDSDYELFGRGSTSTTASSAGTVCTTLLGTLSNNSLVEIPAAPERKSSLNAKSTTTSNYGKPKLILNKNFGVVIKASEREALQSRLLSAAKRSQSQSTNGNATVSDMEVSENSDFEGIERIKRIRGKTQINTKRIPSICVITPLTSDDEDRVAAMEEMLSSLNINQKNLPLSEIEQQTIVQVHSQQSETESALADIVPLAIQICSEFSEKSEQSEQCDDEYVTIKDVKSKTNAYPFNNIIDDNLQKILSGNLNLKTEYVSLNELPCNANYDESNFTNGKNTKLIAGTNVNLKPNGMFVYDSSTLRYKRSLCTTFKGPSIAQDVKPTEHMIANPADCDPKPDDKEEITVDDNRSSSTSSSPFEKMASDSDLTTSLDDVYVTLSTDKRDMNTKKIEKKSFGSVSDPELSDSSKETMSLTWPLNEQTPKVVKRRFSWENITKSTKESKLSRFKRRHGKLNWLSKSKEKKIPPKTKFTFKTSTPLKNHSDKESASKICKESSFGNSTAISLTSNKSIEPQQTTCSDRLGTPKTSLNDFKKLLLNATNKRLSNIKPSAVEQLRLKQESINASPIKILDLSSSPKSFMNRRVFQQIHPSSPHKKSNLMSPRSRWKHNNFNKTPISSIPEANAEDEQTASEIKPTEKYSNTPIYATPRKNPVPVIATNSNVSNEITSQTNNTPIAPIIAKTESSPETGVIETNFTMDDNIFLLSDENNFMKGEVKPFAAKFTSKSSTTGIDKPSVQQSETAESQALETSF